MNPSLLSIYRPHNQILLQEFCDACFAGNIKHFAGLKSIESGSSADGVCSHVIKVEPISDLENDRKLERWCNTIQTITSRAPDGTFEPVLVRHIRWRRRRRVVVETSFMREQFRNRILMVIQNAIEAAVYTVAQII